MPLLSQINGEHEYQRILLKGNYTSFKSACSVMIDNLRETLTPCSEVLKATAIANIKPLNLKDEPGKAHAI